MAIENLVTLSKFENENSVYLIEQITLCDIHYEERKGSFKDYQINKTNSSMPNTWCEVCTPKEY